METIICIWRECSHSGARKVRNDFIVYEMQTEGTMIPLVGSFRPVKKKKISINNMPGNIY